MSRPDGATSGLFFGSLPDLKNRSQNELETAFSQLTGIAVPTMLNKYAGVAPSIERRILKTHETLHDSPTRTAYFNVRCRTD